MLGSYDFLANVQNEQHFTLLITTHSPICIDWSTSRNDSQVLHVFKEGEHTKCHSALEYGKLTKILDDIDVRGSDILQTNGIIWVEGPSDRIYLNKWIELFSTAQLHEGTHYRILFYGGKVLSHFDSMDPEDNSELVQFLSINRNAAVIFDSDRRKTTDSTRKPSPRLNDTKKRVINEVKNNHGFSWVTAGKEIENYIPNSIWEQVVGEKLNITDEFDDIPKNPKVAAKSTSKITLADEATKLVTREHLDDHLDLKENM